MAKTYIRIKQLATTPSVTGRYPVSATTIWRWVAAGKFPKPVKLGAGVTAWDTAELDAFDAGIAKVGR